MGEVQRVRGGDEGAAVVVGGVGVRLGHVAVEHRNIGFGVVQVRVREGAALQSLRTMSA
jgi:hypothetical protein